MKKFRGVVASKWFHACFVVSFITLSTGILAQAQVQDDDALSPTQVAGMGAKFTHVGPPTPKNGMAHTRFGIPNIDSVPNFNGQYFTPGQDPNGNPQNHWYFNTLGNPPEMGGTTTLNAPIVPVSLDLRNADGSPRFVKIVTGQNGQPVVVTCANPPGPGCHRLFFDATQFIQPVLDSPVFSNADYTSSDVPTQFADAVQRAEYFHRARPDWHTLLAPSVKTARTMTLIKAPADKAPNYLFAVNPDGSCCFIVLVNVFTFENELFPSTFTFPPDSSTPVGAAEVAGDITTKDISTFFFPPAFLFIPTPKGNLCCIGGFHAFDFESGDATNGNAPRAFVLNYSTWFPPGFFRDQTILDVTGLSHEISETFNDPFVTALDGVHDVTPWWLSPNGNCQDILEVGDVIEGLPHQVFPIKMPNGFTYHPQNEALLQWFEFESPSSALNGAYSYPDITTLTALSAPQKAGCAP
jgi:hypothetical protein